MIMIMIIIDNDNDHNDNENDDDNDDNTFSSKWWCLLVSVSSYPKEIIVKNKEYVNSQKSCTENISQLYNNVAYHKMTTIEEKYVDFKTLIMLAKLGIMYATFILCDVLYVLFEDPLPLVEKHLGPVRRQFSAWSLSGESISLVCTPFVYCTTLDGLIAAVFADRTGFVERHPWTLIETAITQCGSFCVILSD